MGGQSTQFHSNPKASKNFKNPNLKRNINCKKKTVSNIEDFLLRMNAIIVERNTKF